MLSCFLVPCLACVTAPPPTAKMGLGGILGLIFGLLFGVILLAAAFFTCRLADPIAILSNEHLGCLEHLENLQHFDHLDYLGLTQATRETKGNQQQKQQQEEFRSKHFS